MTVALDRLASAVGSVAERGYRAPGRANVIGEHTDYNGGFVLPVALELSTYVLGRRTGDETVRLRSLDQPGDVVIDLGAGRVHGPRDGWGRYATAVARAARDEGWALAGFDGVVATDVPIGAGLSSSAALEVSVALAILDDAPGPLALARMCQRAENEYVGMRCGIMDQLASIASAEGSALFIDCLHETYEPVAIPQGLSVLVIDSAVRRGLTESGYNERREECERAAAAIGVQFLREADLEALGRAKMDDAARKRARHVITENERVEHTVAAMRSGDVAALGSLFSASHRSMADDFENSTPEVDALVELAQNTPGVAAARMTGGGFGGCIITLVETGGEERAAGAIVTAYERRTRMRARHWISRPAASAARII